MNLMQLSKDKKSDVFYMPLTDSDKDYNIFIDQYGNITKHVPTFSANVLYTYILKYFRDSNGYDTINDHKIDDHFLGFLKVNYAKSKNATFGVYFMTRYFEYYLYTSLGKENIFPTVNKWFIDQINDDISELQKSETIILINNSKFNNFINTQCFNYYDTKIVKDAASDSEISKPIQAPSPSKSAKRDSISAENVDILLQRITIPKPQPEAIYTHEYFLDLMTGYKNDTVNRTNLMFYMNKKRYYKYLSALMHYTTKSLENNNFEEFKSLCRLCLNTLQLIHSNSAFPFYFYNHFLDLIRVFAHKMNQHIELEGFLISFKILVLDIFFTYHNLLEDKDGTVLGLFSQEYPELLKHKIRITAKDMESVSKLLGVTGGMWTASFHNNSILWLGGSYTDIYKFLFGGDIELLNSHKGFCENFNCQVLTLASAMYDLVRFTIYNDKQYRDNVILEKLVQAAENIIDHFMVDCNEFNPGVYIRLLSLISAKNNIKLRYNIDNNKWDNHELLKKYEKEVCTIVDNNFHLLVPGSVAKGMEELGKIQDGYNFFGIHRSLEDRYKKEFHKLNLITSCFATEMYSSLYDIEDAVFCTPLELTIYKNRLICFYETANAILSASLFSGINDIQIVGPHVSVYDKLYDYSREEVNNYWNAFNKQERSRYLPQKQYEYYDIHMEKNSMGFQYVYSSI